MDVSTAGLGDRKWIEVAYKNLDKYDEFLRTSLRTMN
jgi:hypothetical protein